MRRVFVDVNRERFRFTVGSLRGRFRGTLAVGARVSGADCPSW
jgi:hypothetical protein